MADVELPLAEVPVPQAPGDVPHEEENEVPETAPIDAGVQDATPQPTMPTRIYFLRMPKPDVSELEFRKEQAEAELRAYKQACTKALAAAKLANERKLQRREEHTQSQEQFRVSQTDRNTLRDRLRPVSDLNKQVRDQRRIINDRRSQLPAASVAELEAKITELEFQQAHVPMDRKAENNLINEIRKLKKSRRDVEMLEREFQAVENTKDEFATFKSTKEDLERQLDVVNQEFTLAREQMDAKWQLYKDAQDQQKSVSDEFNRLKELQDSKFKECKDLRDAISAVQNSYYENRRFSQSVRQMLMSGKVEDAQAECSTVTEQHISSLMHDPEAYQEYVAGWELTRKYAVSQAAIDVTGSKGSKSKQGKSNNAMLANSDAIMADIMAEIEGRVPTRSAAQVAAESVSIPDAKSPVPKAKPTRGKISESAAVSAATPATEAFLRKQENEAKEMKAKPTPAPSPPVTEAAPAKKGGVTTVKARAVPTIDDEPFVVPEMISASAKAKPMSQEQQKQKIKEEQKLKANEAAERKKKQAQRKVMKAEKAKELAKIRAEEESAKKEADRIRIEREAAVQRAAAQKKKDAQARKAALAVEKKEGVKQKDINKAMKAVLAKQKNSNKQTWVQKNTWALAGTFATTVLLAASGGLYFYYS